MINNSIPAKIELQPIGVIHTIYKEAKDIPIQGIFKSEVEGWIELDKKYSPGLKDLDGFSHAILIYYFHRSTEEHLQGKPFLEDVTHGIFAIRSPHRPNHLGLSIVKIKRIESNRIYFTEVDTLDGTPLLDIKPYSKYFDCRNDVISGWMEKHFQDGAIPERTILH
ncbi:MAG TPA: tRNA (N6-threonylcarbamoyladenosine(37)-N6)-methyltransferase TrmO [bacterium]